MTKQELFLWMVQTSVVIGTLSDPVTIAHAGWEYHEQTSAFAKPTGMAIVFEDSGATALALRCEAGFILAFYMVSEAYQGPLPNVVLLFRFGDAEASRHTALAEDVEGRLRFRANFGIRSAADLTETQKSLSVAVEVNGQIVHERIFSAVGAGPAVRKIVDACSQ